MRWELALGELMRKSLAVLFVAALTSITFPATHLMAVFIPPSGLGPGSQFQLIFVTTDTTAASSSTIGTYNSFVTGEAAPINALLSADGIHGVTWAAVAATTSTQASANAPTYAGMPVYDTNGDLVAASGGLYTLSSLNHAPDYDQNGNFSNTTVWTGGLALHGNRI
jgi:hypothetical protein